MMEVTYLNTDIFSLIKTLYPSFTKSEKKVADLVLSEPQKVLYMSIVDLADTCKVGDTTVFRFCKDLKLKGYQDFKIVLAQSVSTGDNETSAVTGDIGPEDTIEDVAQKALNFNIAALNETFALIDPISIQQAASWIMESTRTFFFGVGTSLITALDAQNLFMRITPKVEVIIDSHMQAMAAALMKNTEVAVVISYSGSSKDTYNVASIAKKAGAKVIVITRFEKSPLTQIADLVLLCGSDEGPLQGGALSSKMSQLYVLNMLYFEVFRKTSNLSKHNKELTADAVADKLY